MRFFAAITLVLVIMQVMPAHASIRTDVREIYRDCLQVSPDRYPGAVDLWVDRIATGQWSLYSMADWFLAMYQRGWERQMRATLPDGSPDKLTRKRARNYVARAIQECYKRQYRGR